MGSFATKLDALTIIEFNKLKTQDLQKLWNFNGEYGLRDLANHLSFVDHKWNWYLTKNLINAPFKQWKKVSIQK